MKTSKKTAFLYVAISAAALTVGAGGTLAAQATAAQELEQKMAAAGSETFASAEYNIASLSSPVEGEPHAFPSHVDLSALGEGGIAAETLSYVGEDAAAAHWTGLDSAGHICLISTLQVESGATAAACETPDGFNDRGVGIQLFGDGVSAEAYLQPDGNESARRAPAEGFDAIGSNLIIADPFASESDRDAFANSVGDHIAVFPEPLNLDE